MQNSPRNCVKLVIAYVLPTLKANKTEQMAVPTQTEIPDAWIERFRNAVASDPTARNAWNDIENACLEETALLLLWGYAGGARPDRAAMHRRTEDISDRIKATVREEGKAHGNAPKRAHDADLFRRRAAKSRETAMQSLWPIPTAETPTLADELRKVEQTGRQPSLTAVRKALTKAAGKRSPINPLYFLLLLQGYSSANGVQLGNKRLLALAYCADPDTKLDEGTLGRYLRSMPDSLKSAIIRDTLPTLPPPRKPLAWKLSR